MGLRFKLPHVSVETQEMADILSRALAVKLLNEQIVGWDIEVGESPMMRGANHFRCVQLRKTQTNKDILIPAQREYFRKEIPLLIEEIKVKNIRCLIFLDKSAREFYLMLRRAWSMQGEISKFPKVIFLNIGSEKFKLIETFVYRRRESLRKCCPPNLTNEFDEMITLLTEEKLGDAGCKRKGDDGRKILLKIFTDILSVDHYSQIFGNKNIEQLCRILGSCSGANAMVIDDVIMSGRTSTFATHIINKLGKPHSLKLRTIFKKDEVCFMDNPQKYRTYTPWSKSGSFDKKHRHLVKDSRNSRKFVAEARKDKRARRRNRKLRSEIVAIFQVS